MSIARHRGAPAAAVIGIVALLLALTTPVRGQVAENKTFTVAVTDVYAGDTGATIKLTLANTAETPQDIGSANVTVPDDYVVKEVLDQNGQQAVDDPQLIELRNLSIVPGARQTFTISVDVKPCIEPEPLDPFTVAAKQSNTFKGTGNDFTLEEEPSDLVAGIGGACRVAFTGEPEDAERDAAITTVAYDDDGAPITVEIRDASPDPERASYSRDTVRLTATNPDVSNEPFEPGGTSSATASGGEATFAPGPELSVSAFEYTLTASADYDGDGEPDAATTSASFDIVDAAVQCAAGQRCAPATAERGDQEVTATFGAGPTDVTVVVSLGAADAPEFSCDGTGAALLPGQFLAVGDEAVEDDEASRRFGQVTFLIPDAARPLKQYGLCWAAPYSFPTADGGLARLSEADKPGTGEDLYVGELADCPKRGEPVRPCISDRIVNRAASEVTIVVKADSRDPWMRG